MRGDKFLDASGRRGVRTIALPAPAGAQRLACLFIEEDQAALAGAQNAQDHEQECVQQFVLFQNSAQFPGRIGEGLEMKNLPVEACLAFIGLVEGQEKLLVFLDQLCIQVLHFRPGYHRRSGPDPCGPI